MSRPLRRWLTPADTFVVLAAALFVGWLFAVLWAPATPPLEVEIRSGGELVARLPLAENRSVEAPGPLGISRIEIRDAQVRFMDSPCSNKVCIHSGWHRHAGETAACLPNRISVRILGRDQRYDAINF
ncbi:MAG: NusG domain II-containing protein [Gammaproteobacteria bacterium]